MRSSMVAAFESWSPGGGGDDHLPRARRRCVRHPRRAPRSCILALPRVPGYLGHDVRRQARVDSSERGEAALAAEGAGTLLSNEVVGPTSCSKSLVVMFWSSKDRPIWIVALLAELARFVQSGSAFVAMRAVIGCGLATFVCCQVWCSQQFSKNVFR